MAKFILASGSPRRRELLSAIGLDFEVVVSETDESIVSKDVSADIYVQELALLKAAASAKAVLKRKDALIIAADTIVTLDGEILGKPEDEDDAFDMLSRLSGRKHEVYTGYCVMRVKDGFTVCDKVKTEVFFRPLTCGEIRKYISTGEPMDKAGAYGIQGMGALLTDKINGDYFNVVGLPVSALAETLHKEFDIDLL